MSWQIIPIRTKSNSEKFEDIKDTIDFTKSEIISAMQKIAEELNVKCESTETDFPVLDGDGWQIEFQINDDCIWLWVSGNQEPTEAFDLIKKYLNTRLFDIHSGRFINQEHTIGLEKWKQHTDEIMEKLNQIRE